MTESFAPPANPLADLRVLLIEDHPAQRLLLRHMLLRLGVSRVQEAGGGREGIARLSAQPFDLIVTDLRMPEGDGLEVIDAVRHGPSTAQVVLLTAVDDDIIAALRQLPREVNGSPVITLPKGCTWPPTISAWAIPRWASCSAPPSTKSRSTANSACAPRATASAARRCSR